jgi:hypothetical protein
MKVAVTATFKAVGLFGFELNMKEMSASQPDGQR